MHQTKLHRAVLILILLIIVSAFPSLAQKIEVYSGANYNHFYDTEEDYSHNRSKYNGGWGYTAGIAIDSLRFNWHTIRICIQYDHYRGSFDASSGGLGGGYSTDGQIQKGMLSLSIYPANFRKIIPRFQLSIGFTISLLMHESFSGEWSGWSLGYGSGGGKLEDRFTKYSKNGAFGLQALIKYRIPISNSLELVPQYSYYLGLTKELFEHPEEMKSMRHYFLIGIQKRIE